jgi:hypothetical protein
MSGESESDHTSDSLQLMADPFTGDDSDPEVLDGLRDSSGDSDLEIDLGNSSSNSTAGDSDSESNNSDDVQEQVENKGDEEFFEGVEKLLEVWFTHSDKKRIYDCDLRRIPR